MSCLKNKNEINPFSVKSVTKCPLCGAILPNSLPSIENETIESELKHLVDDFGGLRYKNVNRIITINLENFSIESITPAEDGTGFSTEYTEVLLKSDGLGGSFYSNNYLDTPYIYYEDPGEFNLTNSSSIYMGILPEDL